MSKRQRPKVDDYADEGYLFAVLHFPVYDRAIQRLNAGRARRLRRPRLPRHAADHRAQAGHAPLPPLPGRRRVPRAALLEGLGPPAVRDPRRPLRLLLPDPRQDRLQARLARGRRLRRPRRRGRPRPVERQAGDHQLPQDHQAGALDPARARAPRRAVPARGARALLRRPRRRRRAHLGHARQLQGGRRGARGHERVGASPTARTTSCAS